MENQIKHTYEGIEITYDEKHNVWRFQLRGRERSSESLTKAKEAIDKPPAEKASKPFVRQKAWYKRYGEKIKLIDVTSIAEGGYSSGIYFWINNGKSESRYSKEREKVHESALFLDNDHNKSLVIEIADIDSQIDALRERKGDAESKLHKFSCNLPE